jgi:hypothetical protein
MNARLPTIIGLWRPVSTCVSRWTHNVRLFEHIGTVHAHATACEDLKRGQVVWGVPDGDFPVAVCWDWAEVRVGIVALANPMTVFSNVRLLAEDGAPLSQSQTLLELNGVIHELDWQRRLCEELSFRRRRTSVPVGMKPSCRTGTSSLRQRSVRAPSVMGMSRAS